MPNPIRWADILSLAAGWNQVWHYNIELVQLAFGYVNHFIKESVPASELARVIRNARLFLLSYFAVICISVWMQTWLPVCLLLLPRAVGAPVCIDLKTYPTRVLDGEVYILISDHLS